MGIGKIAAEREKIIGKTPFFQFGRKPFDFRSAFILLRHDEVPVFYEFFTDCKAYSPACAGNQRGFQKKLLSCKVPAKNCRYPSTN